MSLGFARKAHFCVCHSPGHCNGRVERRLQSRQPGARNSKSIAANIYTTKLSLSLPLAEPAPASEGLLGSERASELVAHNVPMAPAEPKWKAKLALTGNGGLRRAFRCCERDCDWHSGARLRQRKVALLTPRAQASQRRWRRPRRARHSTEWQLIWSARALVFERFQGSPLLGQAEQPILKPSRHNAGQLGPAAAAPGGG